MAGVTWAGRMDQGVAGAVDRNHVVAAAKYRGYKDDVTYKDFVTRFQRCYARAHSFAQCAH